jgi:hypothetical protein
MKMTFLGAMEAKATGAAAPARRVELRIVEGLLCLV